MLYTDECDSSPFGEPCVSVCDDDYMQAMRAEAYIFVFQLHRTLNTEEYYKIRLINNQHDYGTYISLSFRTESSDVYDKFNDDFPEHWDNEAITELLNSDVVVAYYEKYNPEHLQSLRNRQQNINAE